MARAINQLSALKVTKISKVGLHSDGAGLYLRVTGSGGKFWAFRYMLHGKAREMGLGALHTVSLADARLKAANCRKLLTEGNDPIDHRDTIIIEKRHDAEKQRTFQQCAEEYIEDHKDAWRNSKHSQQWTNTLKTYVYPLIGHLPVQKLMVDDIMRVFKQKHLKFKGETFWKARPETASRLRGRVEVILDWATARNLRKGDNPARWKGHMENLLPSRKKLRAVVHQPALPYNEIGSFLSELSKQAGSAADALAFTIFTTSRTSEIIGALWSEIDFEKKTWIIPGHRIKGGREHRVPLSDSAITILKKQMKQQEACGEETQYIFSGQRKGRGLSNMAMLALLKRMKRDDITVHGFRSSFRDWAAEQTNYPREIAEAALAHVSGDKVEVSYLRTDHFGKRRLMMNEWATFCTTVSGKKSGRVVNLGKHYGAK